MTATEMAERTKAILAQQRGEVLASEEQYKLAKSLWQERRVPEAYAIACKQLVDGEAFDKTEARTIIRAWLQEPRLSAGVDLLDEAELERRAMEREEAKQSTAERVPEHSAA
jgi:hypothetical protein